MSTSSNSQNGNQQLVRRDELLEKSLPSHVEGERMILGVVLLDNATFPQANQDLTGDDFYLGSHRKIYAKYRSLWEQGRGIDPLTVQEELRKAGELDDIGGPAYIASLFDGVPRFSDISNYIRIVKEKSLLRQAINAANQAMQAALEDGEEEVTAIARRAQEQFASIAEGVSTNLRARMPYELDEEAWGENSLPRTTPTGFPQLDSLMQGGGMAVGDLVILAARTSRGKSTLALQIAADICDRFNVGEDEEEFNARPAVLFFSMEMSARSLYKRITAIRAQIPFESMQRGSLESREEADRLAMIRRRSRWWEMPIDDIRRLTILDIGKQCRAARRRYGRRLKAIVVDHLGLVSPTPGMRFDSRAYEVQYYTRELKILAGDKNIECPIIVPVQINRVGAKKESITLEDLRESGSIEQDADKVIIFQEPTTLDVLSDGYAFRMTMDKNREGITGQVSFAFNSSYGGFRELPGSLVRGVVRLKQVEEESPRRRGRGRGDDDDFMRD